MNWTAGEKLLNCVLNLCSEKETRWIGHPFFSTFFKQTTSSGMGWERVALPRTVGGGIEKQALEMLSCQPGESLWRERDAPCFTPMHSLRNNRETRAGCNADRSEETLKQGRNLYNSVETWLHHLIETQIRLCVVLLTAN